MSKKAQFGMDIEATVLVGLKSVMCTHIDCLEDAEGAQLRYHLHSFSLELGKIFPFQDIDVHSGLVGNALKPRLKVVLRSACHSLLRLNCCSRYADMLLLSAPLLVWCSWHFLQLYLLLGEMLRHFSFISFLQDGIMAMGFLENTREIDNQTSKAFYWQQTLNN